MTTSEHRVLIVDDEPSLRELIALVVSSGGHRAVAVPTVPDALAELGRRDVDLVVTDLELPGSGGLELLAALNAARGSPPAVVVTGSDDEQLLRTARLLGAHSVVRKPFGLHELRRAVDDALGPAGALLAA